MPERRHHMQLTIDQLTRENNRLRRLLAIGELTQMAKAYVDRLERDFEETREGYHDWQETKKKYQDALAAITQPDPMQLDAGDKDDD